MTRLFIATSVFAASLLVTGCASIFSGTTQSVGVDAVADGRPVQGATCRLSNAKGNWVVTTPGSATINKAADDLQISCSKESYSGISTQKSSFNAQTLLGVFWDLGIFTIPTDMISGGAWTYPTTFITEIKSSEAKSFAPTAAK